MADWAKMKMEYISGGISYRALAAKYNVPFGTLRRVAYNEKWGELRTQAAAEAEQKIVDAAVSDIAKRATDIYSAADRLIDKIAAAIELLTPEDIIRKMKDIRSLTGALLDLKNIREIRSDADMREQEARIAKLQKDAAEDEEGREDIMVVLSDELEEFAQ